MNDRYYGRNKQANGYNNVIMSEQLENQRADKPVAEARYRYLADFSRQDSPNLRKHYRDSYSRHQNSNLRPSPGQRCSPYRSSNKRASRAQRFSPPCSTFNPRREVTQQQFSPYDDRADREQQKLSKQLRQENIQLRAQLIQANQTVECLRSELGRRESELIQSRQANQADLKYFQKVVNQMTGEIQIILTKNKILENQLVVAKARLQEEQRRHEQFARVEEERRKLEHRRRQQLSRIDEERRNIQRRRDEFSRDEKKIAGIISIQNQPPSRRSVGKLMSRHTNTPQEPKPDSLDAQKIKIQEESQSMIQTNCENKRTENLPAPNNEKENRKGEELIESIYSMKLKITGNQANTLKQLWKWLKGLGHSQSCLKRWKSRAESGMYQNGEKLKQLIKEACSYIQ